MKKLVLIFLLNNTFFTKINSISTITNLGPVQLISPNGSSAFEPGTTTIYGNINIGNSNTDIIKIKGTNISYPISGNNLVVINSSGQIITGNSINSSLSCGNLTTTNINASGTLNAGASTVSSLTASSITTTGSLTAGSASGQTITLGNNNGAIIIKASLITPPSIGNNSLLMINSSGQLITANTTNGNFTCGSFAAAWSTGQTITLGNNTGTGNFMVFTGNTGDIVLQSNITNGNIRLNTAINTGNIILSSTGLTPTANASPAFTILAIDRTGNVITSNYSNIFKIGSDTYGNNFISIDNATTTNGILIQSNSLTLSGSIGPIALIGSNIINPSTGNNNLLAINANGEIITTDIINSTLICDGITSGTLHCGDLNAANTSGQTIVLGNDSGSITLISSDLGIPSSGSTLPLAINSNGQIITTTSSKVFKKNINALILDDNAFDNLQPVSFYYINDIENAHLEYGFIAEDLINNKTLKNTIIYGQDGSPLSINYQSIFVAIIADYLKTKKEIQLLKNKIEEKDCIFNQLIKRYDRLEELIVQITNTK